MITKYTFDKVERDSIGVRFAELTAKCTDGCLIARGLLEDKFGALFTVRYDVSDFNDNHTFFIERRKFEVIQ